jgi:hypothetical protein
MIIYAWNINWFYLLNTGNKDPPFGFINKCLSTYKYASTFQRGDQNL